MLYCIHHKRWRCKMRTSLHGKFNVFLINLYVVLLFFNFLVGKARFFANSQSFFSEKSVYGQFEFIFLTYKVFIGQVLLLAKIISNSNFWTKRWSLLLVWTRSSSLANKSIVFGLFRLFRSSFKANFLNLQTKYQRILGYIPERSCWEQY